MDYIMMKTPLISPSLPQASAAEASGHTHRATYRAMRLCLADYAHTKLGLDPKEISALTSDLYIRYGTTMAGLVV